MVVWRVSDHASVTSDQVFARTSSHHSTITLRSGESMTVSSVRVGPRETSYFDGTREVVRPTTEIQRVTVVTRTGTALAGLAGGVLTGMVIGSSSVDGDEDIIGIGQAIGGLGGGLLGGVAGLAVGLAVGHREHYELELPELEPMAARR